MFHNNEQSSPKPEGESCQLSNCVIIKFYLTSMVRHFKNQTFMLHLMLQ